MIYLFEIPMYSVFSNIPQKYFNKTLNTDLECRRGSRERGIQCKKDSDKK